MNVILKLLSALLLAYSITGCSVYKAASNEGINVADISKCTTEGCLLAHGMDVVQKDVDKDGQYLGVYKSIARKSGANYVRAAGHGVLDVMTFGLWEVAGTPVEGALSNNRGYIIAKAVYTHKGQDKFKAIQIYDANGKLTIDKVFPN